ncbi:non-ribosomal peptide synthetase [Dyella flagellata]|nr:amino acid adenylation domain-containing protein [Dyella flagellata]
MLVQDGAGGIYPLTPFQSAIYLAEEFREGPSSYHVPIGLRLEGRIDTGALESALQRVVQRHSILRATFRLEGGQLVQSAAADDAIHWMVRDCGEHDAEWASHEAWVAGFIAQPFVLSHELPIRAARLKVHDTLHVIVLVIHHIVFDGWSRQLLVGEIVRQYERLIAGDHELLPPLPCQYFHYALARARDPGYAAADSTERLPLHGAASQPDVLLPVDMPRRDSLDYPCESVPLTVTGDLTARLRHLSGQVQTTAFVVFLALFNLLLLSRSGRGGTRIACPVNCRERPEELEMIGCFVNTLLFVLPVDLDTTVIDYLHRCRQGILELLPYKQQAPGLAGRDTNPALRRDALAAYRVMFAFQERGADGYQRSGLHVEPFVLHSGRTKCDLTMLLDYDGATLTGAIEYRSDLFHRTTIEGMRSTYQALVQRVLEQPHGSLRDLLAQLNVMPAVPSTDAVRPDSSVNAACLLHGRIAQWAREVPDRIAIESEEGSLSYAQLQRQASQWCRRLRELGIGDEERIGVAIDLGMAAIPAMLGVMQAGAAYVPLDLDLPSARVQAQIQAAGLRRVLCAPDADRARLCGAHALHPSQLQQVEASLAAISKDVDQDSLAYILYTSGSSGVPKGVMVTHRGLNNYLAWSTRHYAMHAAPSLLHTSLLSDMTITTLWGPLMVGQRVHMATRAHGVEGLHAALTGHDPFAVVKLTPSHLRILRQQSQPPNRRWCEVCVVGGEALAAADLQPWLDTGIRFVNEYGPTETVVGSTACDMTGRKIASVAPIGKAIDHTAIHLLDESMQAVRDGATGEIFIAGAGVGRGYAGQPALTAAAFLPDHQAGARIGSRMYRTGDLGMRLADGQLVYQGRRDDQVKIRGYRVELSEVEAALGAHPAVAQVAVLLETQGEFPRLVALVEIKRGCVVSEQALRHFAAQELPSYMLPHSIQCIDALPLLANGKIDRNALRARARPAERGQPEAFGDDIERQLLAIWGEVLGNASMSPTDNFFEAGGDSMSLYVVYRRVAEWIGVEFPAVSLFEYPTIRSCATYLQSLRDRTRQVPERELADAGEQEREQLQRMRQALKGVSDPA